LNDIAKNLAAIAEAVHKAADDKADILLTPEGSLSGYTPFHDKAAAAEALCEITALAARRCVGLALGTCHWEADGVCYDQLRFYLPNGEYLGCHTKTLLCGTTHESPPKGEIEHYGIMPLRVFDYNGLTIGGLVCNDMWGNPSCTPMDDPYLTRKLARMGAKVILHTVNGGRSSGEFSQGTVKRFHESRLLMNAAADKLYIATVDNAHPTNIGVSSYGGVANPKGAWQARLPDVGTQIETVDININLS
jgi:predicted amidohydrolase